MLHYWCNYSRVISVHIVKSVTYFTVRAHP